MTRRLSRPVPGVLHWEVFDPALETWKGAYRLDTRAGCWLLDPFLPDGLEEPPEWMAESLPAGILLTSLAHSRDSFAIARHFDCELLLSSVARALLPEEVSARIRTLDPKVPLAGGLRSLPIHGANAGEVAFLDTRCDGGRLFVGDGILNLPESGLSLLPARYGGDPPVLRESLKALLDLDFEQFFPGHGSPILTGAKEALGRLLDSSQLE